MVILQLLDAKRALKFKNLTLLGQFGGGEYFASLIEQKALVGVASREVPDEQSLGSAALCHLGCLMGGAVVGLCGAGGFAVGKGSFVEKKVYIFDVLCVVYIEAGVAAVCV